MTALTAQVDPSVALHLRIRLDRAQMALTAHLEPYTVTNMAAQLAKHLQEQQGQRVIAQLAQLANGVERENQRPLYVVKRDMFAQLAKQLVTTVMLAPISLTQPTNQRIQRHVIHVSPEATALGSEV